MKPLITQFTENVIETHGLTKSYKDICALKNLDLRVPRNSIFGFLGPNGAGKTTTIKLLLGLAAPTAGRGTVFGLDIARSSIEIRKRTGYLAQDPRYYEYMTAREILRFTAQFFYTGPKQAIQERVEEMINLVGLNGKADRPVKGFSGGERQRLGIAQAQVNYPDLLILDEPAASLDPQGRHDVLDVMERLRKYTTIFYSTHILEDVQRVSDTVCIMNKGMLIAQAPIEQILAGKDGISYQLKTQGNITQVKSLLSSQPWVLNVKITNVNSNAEWEIRVKDGYIENSDIEDQILRLVMSDPALRLKGFERQKQDLEEVFLNMIAEVNHGKP